MKKLCVILVCIVGLGAFKPGILVAQTKQANVSHLKTEYEKFKKAIQCFRQKGWKGCDKAQRKRIVATGVALAGLVIAVIGGVSFALWRTSKRKPIGADVVLEEPVEEKKADVEREAEKALFDAIEQGDIDQIKSLVEKGVDVNAKGQDGATPFQRAVQKENKEVIGILMDNKGAIHDVFGQASLEIQHFLIQKRSKMVDNLFRAVKNNETDAVKELIKKNDSLKDKRNQIGNTLLHEVALSGDLGLAKFLIERGVDKNVTDFGFRATPLHFAANMGHKDIVNLLLDENADVDIKDNKGQTPLAVAVSSEYEDIVGILIGHGANVNVKDKQNNAPFELAILRGNQDIVELLMDKGATIEINREVFDSVKKNNPNILNFIAKKLRESEE